MSKNMHQKGDIIDLTIASVSSGEPVGVGAIVGTAENDTHTDGTVPVNVRNVFKHNVYGHDGTIDAAVAVGDAIYLDLAAKTLDVDTGNTLFGYALAAVASGATTEIAIKPVG